MRLTDKTLSLLLVVFCIVLLTAGCSSSPGSAAGQVSAGPVAANNQPNIEKNASTSVQAETTSAQRAEEKTVQSDNTGGQPQPGNESSRPVTNQDTADKKESPEKNAVQVPQQASPSGSGGPVVEKPESKEGIPVKAYVFTYSKGCCESTRQKIEQHKDSAQQLENKYGKAVSFTWYDLAINNVQSQKEIQQLAKNLGIKNVPALVLVDGKGIVLTRQVGNLNMDEVNKVFERLKI